MRLAPWCPFASAVLRGATLAALIAGVNGCASPTVGVRSASVETVGTEAVRLGVDLELTNPASDPMRLLQWDYTFESGAASYSGRWEALATVPPLNAPILLRLPCVVPAGAFDPTRPWTVTGSLSYRSPSRIAEIFYDLGLVRPSTSFSGGAGAVGASGVAATTTAAAPTPSDSDPG